MKPARPATGTPPLSRRCRAAPPPRRLTAAEDTGGGPLRKAAAEGRLTLTPWGRWTDPLTKGADERRAGTRIPPTPPRPPHSATRQPDTTEHHPRHGESDSTWRTEPDVAHRDPTWRTEQAHVAHRDLTWRIEADLADDPPPAMSASMRQEQTQCAKWTAQRATEEALPGQIDGGGKRPTKGVPEHAFRPPHPDRPIRQPALDIPQTRGLKGPTKGVPEHAFRPPPPDRPTSTAPFGNRRPSPGGPVHQPPPRRNAPPPRRNAPPPHRTSAHPTAAASGATTPAAPPTTGGPPAPAPAQPDPVHSPAPPSGGRPSAGINGSRPLGRHLIGDRLLGGVGVGA